jgi:NAD(P)-dependent dehydrogenase (short-subunit alcohol dehydrogenase family)
MKSKSTVIIAGYSAGFGEALRSRFELDGYSVVTISRQKSSEWHADLTSIEETSSLFHRIDKHMPPLAGVVHNAMIFHRQAFMETPVDVFVDVWSSMVLTAVNVSKQVIPRLEANGGGVMIFSGASGSLTAGSDFSAFSSAKFALRGLTQALSREHAKDGIHVAHVVIDGLIDTKKTEQRFSLAGKNLIDVNSLADQYSQIFHQPKNCWTSELDFRPTK